MRADDERNRSPRIHQALVPGQNPAPREAGKRKEARLYE